MNFVSKNLDFGYYNLNFVLGSGFGFDNVWKGMKCEEFSKVCILKIMFTIDAHIWEISFNVNAWSPYSPHRLLIVLKQKGTLKLLLEDDYVMIMKSVSRSSVIKDYKSGKTTV